MQDRDGGDGLKKEAPRGNHSRPVSLIIKALIILLLIVGALIWGVPFFQKSPVHTANDFLSTLQRGNISEAYYIYMDIRYRNHFSLDLFRKTIEQQPLLLHGSARSLSILEKIKRGNYTLLHGSLEVTHEGIIPIDFFLVEEEGQWRIDSIDFPSPQGKGPQADKGPITIIEKQFEALQKGQVSEAYQYTSTEFQSKTSLEEFEQFIRDYPLLSTSKQFTVKSNESRENNHALVQIILDPTGHAVEAEYKLVREAGRWQIWSLRLIFPSEEAQHHPVFQRMAQPVLQQLALLQRDEIGPAYRNNTSLPFRKATSLDDFTTFSNKFPAFRSHDQVEVKELTLQNEKGKVRIELYGVGGVTEVEYTVGQEGDEWKIWGIQLIKSPKAASSPESSMTTASRGYANFNSDEILEVAEKFLAALRQGEMAKAYYSFTAKEFQTSSSPEEFEAFVLSTPILQKKHKDNFTKLMLNDQIANFSGVLTSPEGAHYPIEFDLVQENGQWKIVQVFVRPPSIGP